MRKIKSYISENLYLKNIVILAGGTAVSQLIALACLPMLTRLFTPADFSVLALYVSLVSLVSVISCLRLEIAIPIPSDNKVAIDLTILSLISTSVITILITFILLLFGETLHNLTNYRLDGILWFIPAGIFAIGTYNSLQYWATRQKDFTLISKTRISKVTMGSATQLSLGALNALPFGLLIGHLVQVSTGVIRLGQKFSHYIKKSGATINPLGLVNTLYDYRRFPKYSTWEALTNVAGVQFPIILIASSSLDPEAGYLMLAMKLLSVPVGLLGGAVAQVYLSEASSKLHDGTLKIFTCRTIFQLIKAGCLPFMCLAILAPYFVPLIFGTEWTRAGDMVSWMVPWFLMQFITSPVSMSLHITSHQKLAMILQIFGVLFRVSAVLYAMNFEVNCVIEIYAMSGFLFYILYLFVIMRTLK